MIENFEAPREIINIKEADSEMVSHLVKELGVCETIGKTLVNRKLYTYESCKKFFRPEISHFHDPYLFENMEDAVNRIVAAIQTNERIYIHGDYDVDGVAATALMVSVLRKLGANCEYYLPNRLTDGYGISMKSIQVIKKNKGSLIITVDCGITAQSEIDFASEYGIDVIVTDHHEPFEHLPQALAILDPKCANCSYPEKNLAGVGVALKLCQALVIAKGYNDSLWQNYLDLAALGTAADIVPLIGENRTIAKLGFEQLSQTSNIGLQKLISSQNLEGKKLSTNNVVFILAPCINAAGRLGDSTRGVKLLLTENEDDASRYARELVAMNKERRILDKHVLDSAVNWVFKHTDFSKDYVLVAGDTDWHVGVIGITASKLVERFYRPAFLFSNRNDGYAKGSGRSVKGLHLLDALKECDRYLESYGGHEAAAGATIKVDNMSKFRDSFNAVVKTQITSDTFVPHIYGDAEVNVEQLTPKLLRIIKQMEPFGPGNLQPVLVCRGLTNRVRPRIVGKNHLKLTISSKENQVMEAIAFNFGSRIREIDKSNSFSLAFSLDENTWNGRTCLHMKVKGMAIDPQ